MTSWNPKSQKSQNPQNPKNPKCQLTSWNPGLRSKSELHLDRIPNGFLKSLDLTLINRIGIPKLDFKMPTERKYWIRFRDAWNQSATILTNPGDACHHSWWILKPRKTRNPRWRSEIGSRMQMSVRLVERRSRIEIGAGRDIRGLNSLNSSLVRTSSERRRRFPRRFSDRGHETGLPTYIYIVVSARKFGRWSKCGFAAKNRKT